MVLSKKDEKRLISMKGMLKRFPHRKSLFLNLAEINGEFDYEDVLEHANSKVEFMVQRDLQWLDKTRLLDSRYIEFNTKEKAIKNDPTGGFFVMHTGKSYVITIPLFQIFKFNDSEFTRILKKEIELDNKK